jgi:hypothetical protein
VADTARNGLILAVTLLGALNAVLRPVAASLGERGWVEAAVATFGVNPAVWVALTLAALNLHSATPATLMRRDVALAAGVLVGLTIPSATVSWLVLAGYGVVLCLDTRLSDLQRAGALILVVAALRDPIVSASLHLLNEPLLALDAVLAAAALAPFVDGVHAQGNLVLGADGARLVILTSCSSLANLSYALLFWFAVSRTLLPRLDRNTWFAAAAIAAALVALNVARLALMAASDSAYALIHGATGRLLFEALMLLLLTGFTLLGVRHALAKHPRGRAAVAARPA